MDVDYTQDHKTLNDAQATRRYFAKFERIIDHLDDVTKLSEREKLLSHAEGNIIRSYLKNLANTFTALSYKFLMADRVAQGSSLLNIDKSDSGFPIYQELLQMAADTTQAPTHLKTLPSQERLKKDMISYILNEQKTPLKTQYALSQRIYYEYLTGKKLFLSGNDPQAIWQNTNNQETKRTYLVHWASYDSQTNVPCIYLMELEDTGKKPLLRDERRWPRVQSHLMAQSMSVLTLLTIARGIDQDFDALHPVRLRRFHLGPMYSHTFTEQHGPLRDILAEASGKIGEDWALVWRVETLETKTTITEKTGFFSTAQRQVYKIDTLDPAAADHGATDIRRSIILPHRAYQIMEEQDLPSMNGIRKYVVGENDKILSYS